MRIGIDARMYGARHTGGIGRYLENILTELAKKNDGNTYVIFLRKVNFNEAPDAPQFEKHLVDIPIYSLSEQTKLPREVAAARVDFMHYPHWNIPLLSRVPFVVTIHDTILLDDPHSAHATTHGTLLHGLKYLGFRLAIERAVFGAKKVIAVSESVKRDILRHFSVKSSKIEVIPNIVHIPATPHNPQPIAHSFLLYVGPAYPHKNLPFLLRAFALAREALPTAKLVIAGKNDAFMKSTLDAASLSDAQTGSKPVSTSWSPSDAELARLYRTCAAFVCPSLLEGFGLPPCEAILSGAPVIASSIPVLHEVCGDAAYYASPTDERAWASLMLRALQNDLPPPRQHPHPRTPRQKIFTRPHCQPPPHPLRLRPHPRAPLTATVNFDRNTRY